MALETGTFDVPASGSIAVFRPRAGDDLSALGKDRVTVVQGFRPDHDWFAAQGYRVATRAERPATAALVCLPRSKAEARALVAEASALVAANQPVIVDGQKTDGVDALHRDIRARVETSPPLAKAHGKIFSFPAGARFDDWAAREAVTEDGFVTVPGLFSADGPTGPRYCWRRRCLRGCRPASSIWGPGGGICRAPSWRAKACAASTW